MSDKAEKVLSLVINKAMMVGKVAELKEIHAEMDKGVKFLSLSTGRFVAEYGARVPINSAYKATKLISKTVSDMMKKRDAKNFSPTETSTPMTEEAQKLYSFFHEQMSLVRISIASAEKR